MEAGTIIALASCAIAFVGLLVTIILSSNSTARSLGSMENKIDHMSYDVKELKSEVKNLQEAVIRHDEKLSGLPCLAHEKQINDLYRKTQRLNISFGGRGSTTETNSPETLSEKGWQFAKELGFATQIEKNWRILSSIPGKNELPYDIQ